jgi:hypothetical protein
MERIRVHSITVQSSKAGSSEQVQSNRTLSLGDILPYTPRIGYCPYFDHIHTPWIWSVFAQPIASGPEAGDFARVSPEPWRAKDWHSASILIKICFSQKNMNMTVFYFGRFFGGFVRWLGKDTSRALEI